MPARPQLDLPTTPFHHYLFDDGTVWTEFHRSEMGYLLRFPDLADFEVSVDGREVVSHPIGGVDETTVEHLFINQLAPLAMSRQGRPSFHASVVTVPDGAVAFLGKTGMGKSTLAASFALYESAFLTDDALLIEETDDGCLVLPSHASLRLWEDSVEALIEADAPQADVISYSSKARILAGGSLTFHDEPLPLLAAFVLGNEASTDVSIQALAGLDRYMSWLENSFVLDVTDQELLSQHFSWTDRISAGVPTFALDYPRDYGILPDVRRAVRRHLADVGN